MKEVIVLGLGLSGKAAAMYLLSKGLRVIGIEENLNKDKMVEGVEVFQTLSLDVLQKAAFAVASPGIPPHSSWYRELKKHNVEVVGEAEFFLRVAKQPVIGITGTNGKTTVTLLIEHVLKEAGKKSCALGNVGNSFGEYFIDPDPEEIVVAELSSFQLEKLQSQVLDVGIVLNIGSDHLDWHGTLNAYAEAKLNMGRCMKPGGSFFVYHKIAKQLGSLLEGIPYFSFGKDQEKIATNLELGYRKLPKHEWDNANAAWLASSAFGVTAEEFCQAYLTFERPKHRLEFVATIAGVSYFNDSKGTNCDAVLAAVRAMRGVVYLIAGGVDKGGSFEPWKESFENKVKKILAIGEAAGKIREQVGSHCDVEVVHTLARGVKRAASLAKPQECILLSPGCASFDQFRSYCDRGDKFRDLVLESLSFPNF